MGNAIFTHRALLCIVKRRGEKSRGVRNEMEKTLVLGSVVRKAPSAWQRERGRRRGDSFGVIYLDFIFIVPGHAKVTIYRFFFGAPPWCSSDIINVNVPRSFWFLRFTARRETQRDDNTRERYHRWCLWQKSFRSETGTKSNLSPPFRANVFHGRQKFAEFEGFKRVIVIYGDW